MDFMQKYHTERAGPSVENWKLQLICMKYTRPNVFFFSIRLIKWPCQRKKEMHRDFTGHTLVKWSCKNQIDLLMIRKCEGNCISPRYNSGH